MPTILKGYAMKKIICLLILFCIITPQWSFADESFIKEIPIEQVRQTLNRPTPPHPRLFLADNQLPDLLAKINSDKQLKALHEAIIRQADKLIDKDPVRYKKTGRRLLSVSREALKRLTMLSWAYRATGNTQYLKQAEKEMLTIAAFSDWNPSHFLDVAEMTTALAIGYDWLFNDLSEQSRNTIQQAIVEKGIMKSLAKNQRHGWINGTNNWNQVCHGGITCGVLAVMEDEPQLTETIIHRSVNKVQIAMAEYEPDGAYPEGPGYWQYGTTFNVLLIEALESVLKTDFGLSEANSFKRSAEYYLHATAPTGRYYNYADCGSRGDFLPTVFWFTKKYKDPSLAWHQQKIWQDAIKQKPSDLMRNRTAVMALLWAQPNRVQPEKLSWVGRGANPVAMFRSSWDTDAVYLGIKGGTPKGNHAHMDAGSFIIEADGVRWAVDLGPENYNKIETLGLNLWSRVQNSDRWKIFRYNNFSHNTLTVNDQLQQVDGFAKIISRTDSNVVFDLTSLYSEHLQKAARGAALLPTQQVLIQDELTCGDEPATVRWQMATPADIEILSDTQATLSQKGKKMQFEIIGDIQTKLQVYSAEPRADYDQPNPGISIIGFEIKLNPEETKQFGVLMTPDSASDKPVSLKPLDHWSADKSD